MANTTTKVTVLFCLFVFLQVSCAVSSRPHAPAAKSVAVNVAATMTVNGFQQGEGGGGPAACDGQYHSDDEAIVSLSSEWFDSGARCGRYIRIQDSTYLNVIARVVDECRDCDSEVGASTRVWQSFHLDPSVGEATIRWSDDIESN